MYIRGLFAPVYGLSILSTLSTTQNYRLLIFDIFSIPLYPSKVLFIPLCVSILILFNPLILGNFAYIIQARK